MFLKTLSLVLLSFSLILANSAQAADSGRPQPEPRLVSDLDVSIRPIGTSEEAARTLTQIALEKSGVLKSLEGARYHVLGAHFPLEPQRENSEDRANDELRVDVYDYTHRKLIEIRGDSRMERFHTRESADQPPPSAEEYQDAIAILKADPAFGGAHASEWKPYQSMPGLVDGPDLDRSRSPNAPAQDRIIALGILPLARNTKIKHEIVGVDLNTMKVLRYEKGAPPTAAAVQSSICSWDSADGPTTDYGVPGQTEITVKKGGAELWKFQVTRPSSSSGFRGSGIDIEQIYYKGKRVMSEIHVPILTVQYEGDVCGPYRDWTYSEGNFVAHGDYIASGILKATSRPSTIFETGNDSGNFNGIAVYADGPETVLVTKMEAGWYRYKAEYRFNENGEIKPRWGFSGVKSSCTCRQHYHHGYWRMHFKLGDGNHEQLQAFDGHNWVPVTNETKFYRNGRYRQWRVIDVQTKSGYMIEPGPYDGVADSYGRGDLWAVKYRPGEIEDSRVYAGTAANLDAFLRNDRIGEADIVLWYGAHIYHHSDNFDRDPNEIAGPTLKPVQW